MQLTYRQLAKIISELPESNQDDNVTVFDSVNNEFYPATKAATVTEKETDVLDAGHLAITV